MTAPRVLVVDDQAIYRTGLRTLLEESALLAFAGEASDGAAAVTEWERLRPDIVLMDIRMPHIGGIEATRTILARDATAIVVMLTMLEDDVSLTAALRAGARGYLLKGATPEQIERTVLAACDGDTVISQGVAPRLVAFFTTDATDPPPAFPGLTRREHDILRLVAEGLGNVQIADRLFLSEKTIRNNVSAIIGKLGVASRPELIVRARERGLGTSENPGTFGSSN